jgi:exonuclease SbcD
MLRLIHTADWHLGHTLHGVARDFEHERFLAWLLEALATERTDALVVAGDVFDSANPPASAQATLFRFLRDAKQRLPGLAIVIVGGNHDSASRLAAPAPVLDAFGVHVVGGIGLGDGGEPDWDRLVVPLRNAAGEVEVWLGAMPFLRTADLPRSSEAEADDPLIAGVAERYAALMDHLRAAAEGRGALALTGHCYMTGGQLSELSERKILGGNQHALPVSLFSDDVAYVALGHLHLAQAVGGAPHVRYSGSPIPLSLDEAGYPHQVLRVDFGAGSLREVQALRVPRAVEILRVPAEGAAPLDDVVEMLAGLELPSGLTPERYPFLEVRVVLDRPQPALRPRLDEALAGRPVRLLKVTASYAGSGGALADAAASQLDALAPDQVFARRYQSLHDEEPPADLMAAFHELVDQVGELG